MKFEFPGWGMGWFTLLLAVCCPIVAYSTYVDRGDVVLTGFWLSIGVLSALTWFRQRWVAIPLIGFFLLALVGIAIGFAQNGFRVSYLIKGFCTVSVICELWAWRRTPSPQTSIETAETEDAINPFSASELRKDAARQPSWDDRSSV